MMTAKQFIEEFQRTRHVTITRTGRNSVRAYGNTLSQADKDLLRFHRRALFAALVGIDLDMMPVLSEREYAAAGIHRLTPKGGFTHSLGDDQRDRLIFGLVRVDADEQDQLDRTARIIGRSAHVVGTPRRAHGDSPFEGLLPDTVARVEAAFPRMNAVQRVRFAKIADDYRLLKHELAHGFTHFSASEVEPRLASPRSCLNPAVLQGSRSQDEEMQARREGRATKIPKRRDHHEPR